MEASTERNARIRIKIGNLELEYEGDSSFLDGALSDLLKTISDLTMPAADEETLEGEALAKQEETEVKSAPGAVKASTNTIAAHLNAFSCSELAVASLAYLEIVQGQPKLTRADILKHMQAATSYYNKNMRGNLSGALKTFIKSKRINEIGAGTYSLSAAERKRLEQKLAEIG